MNPKKYSLGRKAAALLINLFGLAALLSGLLLFLYLYHNYGIVPTRLLSRQEYTDTAEFKDLLENDAQDAVTYAWLKAIFEDEEGNFNPYCPFLYVYGSSYASEEPSDGEFSYYSTYTFNDIKNLANYYGLYFPDDSSESSTTSELPILYKDLDQSVMVYWFALNPDTYSPFFDSVTLLDMSGSEITYLSLMDAIHQTVSYYEQYLSYQTSFESGNFRFSLSYYNPYTRSTRSVGNFKDPAGSKTEIEALPLFWDSSSSESSYQASSLFKSRLLDSASRYNLNSNQSFTMIFGCDTSFPAQDDYQSSYLHFQRINQALVLAAVCSALGGILVAVTLVILYCSAGHERGSSSIRLSPVDKIPTEISALLLFYLFARGIMYLFQYINSILTPVLILGILYLIFLTGSLSFARRLKARTLFSDSALVYLYRFAKKLFSFINQNGKASLRQFLLDLFFLIPGFILCFLLGMLTGSLSVFLLLMALLLLVYLPVYYFQIKKFHERTLLQKGVKELAQGNLEYQFDTSAFTSDELWMADTLNHIGEGMKTAVEGATKSERMKAELITNVSHDIKTPLTSIINYVTLLRQEPAPSPTAARYLEILDQKSARLKHLIEDLVEASKASTGNLSLELAPIDFVELINQVNGEFEERFQSQSLTMVVELPSTPVHILADGRRIWRVLENLYQNVYKYAMPQTRVYISLAQKEESVLFSIKNISAAQLNISADELTERFVRGDSSRTTEGNGLGLSIAKSLTQLQNGTLELFIDGDLFRAEIRFPSIAPLPSS